MIDRTPLLVFGARSFAPEVADLASETPGYEVIGYVENLERERCEQLLEGLPVFWIDDVAHLAASHAAICALGTTKRRALVERAVQMGFRFATIVHPSARVSPRSALGEGVVVSAGVIVGAHTRIGRHVLLNRGVLVGHHTEVGDYCSLQPGANVAGSCRLGDGCFVGMGAIVIDHVEIGAGAVVGAGSLVTEDVPESVQVVGVPARIVRRGVCGR